MKTVFIIEDVKGKNFLPAKEFGDLRVILTGKEDVDQAMDKIRHTLVNMTADDYLLLVGSPIHIALASHYVLKAFGRANFLVWCRDYYRYNCEEIRI